MDNGYKHLTFEQLERKLLSMLDDAVHRLENKGEPLNVMTASLDDTLEFSTLASEIKDAAKHYNGRIVKNRFKLAPRAATKSVMIDPGKPSVAELDYAARIAGLVSDGKVIRRSEHKKYSGIFERHPRWKGRGYYPDPGEIKGFIVEDSESLSDGRRPNWMPSESDERFILNTLSKLKDGELILAAEADRYEEVMAKHPKFAENFPGKVRGAAGRKYKEKHSSDALIRAIEKRKK